MSTHRTRTARPFAARSLAAVLALAAGATLAACSSSGTVGFGHASPVGRTSQPATHSAPASTTPAPTTDGPTTDAPTTDAPTTPAPTTPAPQADDSALLLDADEVGGGFRPTTSDTVDTPLPCTPDAPGPLTQVPPAGHAQADFAAPSQDVVITERVITYAGEGDSERVLDAVHRGFGCASAAVGGTTLQIAGPNDVRSSITANVDQADYWQLRSSAGDVDMVVVRIGSTVVQLAFSTAPGASIQVDPNQVLETAIAKAVNGG